MSQELIYTSAPQGLKPGSKGFCTVAMTTSITASWVERLESLSGYRPIFPLGDPQSTHNPINWSHWRITLAGKTRSVLSRIAFAGADYSQRSNKIAHHIVLEPLEQAPAGPAWMMLQNGVMRTGWSGAPQQFPAGPNLPNGDRVPRICSAWAKALGDAGWAGVLPESFAQEPSKPAYLIYTPGTNVLELFEESLSLLSPQQRWEVTFSTFFTELPLKLTCDWRAVVAGTPAATEASRAGARAMILDLTKPPKTISLTSGVYADAARDGRGVVTTPIATPRPAAARVAIAARQMLDDSNGANSTLKLREEAPSSAPLKRSSADRKRLTPTAAFNPTEENLPEHSEPPISRRQAQMPGQVTIYRGIRSWIAGIIAVACLLIGGTSGYFLGRAQKGQSSPVAQNDQHNSSPQVSPPLTRRPPLLNAPATQPVPRPGQSKATNAANTKASESTIAKPKVELAKSNEQLKKNKSLAADQNSHQGTGTPSSQPPTSNPLPPEDDVKIDWVSDRTEGIHDTYQLSNTGGVTASSVLALAWPANAGDSCTINGTTYTYSTDSQPLSLSIEATHKNQIGEVETSHIVTLQLQQNALRFTPEMISLPSEVQKKIQQCVFIIKQDDKTIARFAFKPNPPLPTMVDSDVLSSLSGISETPLDLHAKTIPDGWEVLDSKATKLTYTKKDDPSLHVVIELQRSKNNEDGFRLLSNWNDDDVTKQTDQIKSATNKDRATCQDGLKELLKKLKQKESSLATVKFIVELRQPNGLVLQTVTVGAPAP